MPYHIKNNVSTPIYCFTCSYQMCLLNIFQYNLFTPNVFTKYFLVSRTIRKHLYCRNSTHLVCKLSIPHATHLKLSSLFSVHIVWCCSSINIYWTHIFYMYLSKNDWFLHLRNSISAVGRESIPHSTDVNRTGSGSRSSHLHTTSSCYSSHQH